MKGNEYNIKYLDACKLLKKVEKQYPGISEKVY